MIRLGFGLWLVLAMSAGSVFGQEKPEFVKVDVRIVKAALEYLNTRPHGEVRQLYDAFLKSEPIKEEKEKTDEKTVVKPDADSNPADSSSK